MWAYAWYLEQILEDPAFAQQVEQIQAQVLIDKAVEAAPYHPGIHQTLLKALRPERFALSGKEQLDRRSARMYKIELQERLTKLIDARATGPSSHLGKATDTRTATHTVSTTTSTHSADHH